MSKSSTSLSIADLQPKMEVKGVVKRIELVGALVDIGIDQDAMLHISQLKGRRVNNVRDVLSEGQEITVWIQNIDQAKGRVGVTMVKPPNVDWDDLAPGQIHTGQVVRVEKFGLFVDIGAERPGLVHVSQVGQGYVKSPGDVAQTGDVVEVKILGVDRAKNQIDLSMKAVATSVAVEDEPEDDAPTAMALALQRAMQKSGQESGTVGESGGQKGKQRAEQEDILRRTLEQHGQG